MAAEHGTRSRYVQGCRCDACTTAQRLYTQGYRADPERRARDRAINKRAKQRASLAAAWLRTNRPDVWADICHEVNQ